MITRELAVAILRWAAPLVLQIVRERRAHRMALGEDPDGVTDAEITDTFNNNIDRFLGEGQAWRAQHPDA